MIHRLTIDAFAAGPGGMETLATLAEQPTLARCRVRVQPGGIAAAMAAYATQPTPQVVIVEAEEAGDSLLERLDQLADVCEANTRVVVLGADNDIRLYRTLLARGVSDYLPLPLTAAQVASAVCALYADPQAAPRAKVVAFWGARGGSGASTLAQNAAWCLGRHLREAVLYIDLDVAFGTSGLAFDIETRQSVADVLSHPDRMDPVMLERCLVEYDESLKVLAAPGDPRITARLDVDAVDRLLDMASRLAAMVVVDLPRQWNEWVAQVLYSADEVVLVSVPDLASLRDSKTLLEILGARRAPTAMPKLVLNRVDPARRAQLSDKVFTDTLGMAPVLSIPQEPQSFGVAANEGRMVPEAASASRAAQSLRQLAALLAGRAMPVQTGLRHKLAHWLKG
ncbi:MAG TPA: cellulose synthase operon protein YhjQ/BcsQ [Magnetospirillum sp.]|nr:cellulose synthase operon protein YhjQ/BcsQ [Magnetospirillum sp.]